MAAINKRKILESAQRNVQKGALDKAVKDYQSILDADPRDANVRLKLGDLQLRRGQNDDAIACYLKVADQFMRDGFDAKAVAIYKQVSKIDPKRYDLQVPLADLYQRLGLVSEAMGALQAAADAYHRDGRKREALDLLRRMASLDPANVTSRLKVAELLQQEGLVEEALAEYTEASAELERQGDWEARIGVLERLLELAPDRADALEAVVGVLLARDQSKRAMSYVERWVAADPESADAHETLARLLAEMGDGDRSVQAYRAAAEAWRVRGDEHRAREIMQRYVPSEPFSFDTPGIEGGLAAPEANESPFGRQGEGIGSDPVALDGALDGAPVATNDDDLETDPGFEVEPPRAAPPVATPPAARPARKPAPAATPKAPAPAPKTAAAPAAASTAEADTEQLLAEAAVYLRYGKHERAVASLESVLAREPEHAAALDQLGEVRAAAGDPERAVEAWSQAFEAALAGGDVERAGSLRDRIAALDPMAAVAFEDALPAASSPARAAAPPTVLFGMDGAEVANESTAPPGDAPATFESSELDEIEIDVDASEFAEPAEEPAEDAEEPFEVVDPHVAEPAGEVAAESSHDVALEEEAAADEDPGEGIEIDLDAGALDEDAVALAPETSSGIASPLAAADDEDAVQTPPESWELPADELEASESEEDVPAPAAAPPPAVPAPTGELSGTTSQQILEDFEEAGFYFEQGLLGEAEAIYLRILSRAPSHPGALLRLGEIAVQRGRDPGERVETAHAAPPASVEAHEAPEIEPPDALDLTEPTLEDAATEAGWANEPVEAASDDTTSRVAEGMASDANGESVGLAELRPPAAASAPLRAAAPVAVEEPELTAPDMPLVQESGAPAFDLAAELSEALADPAAPAAGARAATDEDGFDALFREFKRGVSQTLGEGDIETHFDLGIAYREMGLFEDAIGEFRYALGTPTRRLDALHMMGLCALDIGRPQDGVGHLEQALATPEVPAEREVPLRFDLGRAYQALGDAERALGALRRVQELDAGFQDVGARIEALERGGPPPAAEPAAAEAYESFDDLIAETAEEPAPEPEPEPEPERYESFDDVIAEAAEEDASAAAAVAAALEAPVAAEPAEREPAEVVEREPVATPETEPEPAPSAPRRRRKVSFV